MELEHLADHWTRFGAEDPMWAILTDPNCKNRGWDPEAFFRTGKHQIDQVMEIASQAGYPQRRNSALDFGCGVGRLTQALAEHFELVAGVDISPTMLEEAEQYNRHGERVTYFLNQKNSLGDFPDESFNFIYSIIVLQHMHPSISLHYLVDFVRLLSRGGMLLVQIPDHLVDQPRAEGEVRTTPHLAGAEHYTETTMEMYGIARCVVEGVAKSAGARLLWTRPNQDCGPEWVSWLYAFVKD